MVTKKRIICAFCASEKLSIYCNHCKKRTPSNESIEVFGKHRLRGLWKISLGGKGKKASSETRSGWKRSGDPKKRPVYLDRIIDRVKDEYHEVVRDAETDKISHEVHEPLTQHKHKK